MCEGYIRKKMFTVPGLADCGCLSAVGDGMVLGDNYR